MFLKFVLFLSMLAMQHENRQDFSNYYHSDEGIRVDVPSKETWELWGSYLIDWSHFHLLCPTGIKPARTGILSYPGEPAYYTRMLVELVQTGTSKQGSSVVTISSNAQKRFKELLNKTKSPILLFPELPHPSSESLGKETFKIKSLVQEWEEFAVQYKNEPYLPGYAKLLACILQARWYRNSPLVIEKFEEVEREYSKVLPVSLMANWYRCTLLVYTDAPEASEECNKFALKYCNHNWWVVRAANYLSNHTRSNRVFEHWRRLQANPFSLIDAVYKCRQVHAEELL